MHKFPATVPRFWIWIEPTSRAADLSASKQLGSGACSTSVQVVRPPIRISLSWKEIPRNLGDFRDVHNWARYWAVAEGGEEVGAARQNLSTMAREGIYGLVKRPGSEVQAVCSPTVIRRMDCG